MIDKWTWIVIALMVVFVIGVSTYLGIFLHEQHQAQRACDQQHGVLLSQPGLHWACIERGQH